MERERLGSRLGFILLSAGCAIGLGNVWRFPYVTGMYGGAIFVAIYAVFLVILGIPVMTMEFAVGRASRKSVACSFKELQPKGGKWHLFSYLAMAGNYLLMMFYTTIAGWILSYLLFMIRGDFTGATPERVGEIFGALTSNPTACVGWMIFTCALGFGICALGLQNGVERITKIMMSALIVVMLVLVVRSVTLPNAIEGLSFYLKPNPSVFAEYGFGAVVFAAMGQAFFTLSLGVGSMAIFGSYIGKEHSLVGESINITILDTLVAFSSGLIVFPACFSFGINPGEGPGLIFVTLPNIFNQMWMGRFWGVLFFIFMAFAALSTVIAVFENLLSFAMDLTGCSRKKAAMLNMIAVMILSLPCALGFNVLSGIQPFGEGSVILDLEDFILSNNLLPFGALIYLLFCVSKFGWGWDNFIAEANEGKGIKMPTSIRFYLTYCLPLIIAAIFVLGYITFFS